MVESLFLLKLEPVPEPDPLSNTAQEQIIVLLYLLNYLNYIYNYFLNKCVLQNDEPVAMSAGASSQRSRVVQLYKSLLHLGREYPQGKHSQHYSEILARIKGVSLSHLQSVYFLPAPFFLGPLWLRLQLQQARRYSTIFNNIVDLVKGSGGGVTLKNNNLKL